VKAGTPPQKGSPLEELSEKELLAVTLYTNPLYGETFGNKTISCSMARMKSASFMYTAKAKAAIRYLDSHRDNNSERVQELISRYTPEAVRGLIKQTRMDDEARPMRMPEHLLLSPNKGELAQARAISDHNRAVAALAREAREATKVLLSYHLGLPGQQTEAPAKRPDSPLAKMSTEEFRKLARRVIGEELGEEITYKEEK